MSNNISSEQLARITMSILEEAAFIFAEPADPPPPFEGEVIEAKVTLEGPCRGLLLLSAAPEFAINAAANLLGIEPDEANNPAIGSDAIGELLNIISGQVIEGLIGSQQTCKLSVPQVLRVSASQHEKNQKENDACISLITEDGYRLDIAGTYETLKK